MQSRSMFLLIASAAWLWGAGSALAVPDGIASWTAFVVCEFRALAAQHPDPKLRSRDHLAAKLCPPSVLPGEYAAARRIIDAKVP